MWQEAGELFSPIEVFVPIFVLRFSAHLNAPYLQTFRLYWVLKLGFVPNICVFWLLFIDLEIVLSQNSHLNQMEKVCSKGQNDFKRYFENSFWTTALISTQKNNKKMASAKTTSISATSTIGFVCDRLKYGPHNTFYSFYSNNRWNLSEKQWFKYIFLRSKDALHLYWHIWMHIDLNQWVLVEIFAFVVVVCMNCLFDWCWNTWN